MFAATFFFLAISGFFVLASLCLLDEKAAAAGHSTMNWSQRPKWHKRAKWPEIKAAWLKWYVQCQKVEAPRQKTLLSWGRTMALCAALCLIGAYLSMEFDAPTSVPRLWSSFKHSHSVAHHTWQLKPSWSTPIPTTNQSAQE
jgi:hypothetical protein